MSQQTRIIPAARARHGEGERPRTLQRLARLAADHSEEALETLVTLMRTAKRETVRESAARALLTLAAQAEDEGEGRSGKVLQLVDKEEAAGMLVAELDAEGE